MFKITTEKLILLFMVYVLIVLPGSPVMSAANGSEKEWKLYRQENGIKGFERRVEKSKFLETRAETLIEAPLEVILEILMDVPAFPKWMHGCAETILIEQKDILTRIIYFVQETPWPAKDQDAIIRADTILNLKRGLSIIGMKSIKNYSYNDFGKGRKRMIEFSGEFDLCMLDRKRTFVVYSAYSHPSGFAPKGIADRIIRNVSFNTIRNLIIKSKEDTYIRMAAQGPAKKEIEKAIKEGRLKYKPSIN